MKNCNIIFAIVFLLCSIQSKIFSQVYSIVTIYTPNGTPVEALLLVSGEWTSGQKAAIRAELLVTHPNVVVLDDPTWTYNCHGFAWHMSEGNSGVYWINYNKQNGSENVANYWLDASYMEVCGVGQGTKIHYYAGDHSAIKSSVSGKYESKWGSNCRVRHDPTDVPPTYQGSQRRYYRRIELKPTAGLPCGNTVTFSILNIGASSYSWASGPGLSGSSSSTSAIFTKLNNGSEWARVTANWSGCSGKTATRYATITGIVGGVVNQSGQPSKIMLSTMAIVANSQATIDLSYLPNPSSISVTYLNGSGTWNYNASLKKLYVTLPTNASISFSIQGSGNTCGNYSRSVTFYTPNFRNNQAQEELMIISPNPVENYLHVRIPENVSVDDVWENSEHEQSQEIRAVILDISGKIVYDETQPESMDGFSIAVSGLPEGTYYLNVVYRGKLFAEKFLKSYGL